MRNLPIGVRALSAFFVFGALASGFSLVTLLFPGGPLDVLWQVNPRGHAGLRDAGIWGMLVMGLVCFACASAARGLWLGAEWGRRLAIGILAVNLLGDSVNAFVLGD